MRHLSLALLCAVVLLGTPSCRKKSSPEYYDAEGRHSVLVASMGDDAYLDEQMQAVLAMLDRVPPKAREAERAAALRDKIKGEIARVQKDNEARDQAIENAGTPAAPTIGSVGGGAPALQPVPVPVTDADGGPAEERPVPGMTEADFRNKFASCTEPGVELPIPGEKAPGTMFMVVQSPDCQKKYGVKGGKLAFVFTDGKLRGTMVRSETKSTVIVDAGTKPVVIGVIDAGVTYVLPGAPLPVGAIILDGGL